MTDLLVAIDLPAVEEPVRYLVLGILAALLVSMGKAGFGGGVGLLSYPLMIMACRGEAMKAAGIMLPLLVLCDYVSVLAWWRRWNIRVAVRLVPGLLVGLAVGCGILAAMGRLGRAADGSEAHGPSQADAALMLAVGLIALGFVVLQFLRRKKAARVPVAAATEGAEASPSHASASRSMAPAPANGDAARGDEEAHPSVPGFWETALLSTSGGVTTMLAHAAGPIITIYMLRHSMPKDRFAATTSFFYWIGNQIKIPLYVALGLLDTEALVAAAWLAPAIVVGTLLGVLLNHRVRQAHFTGIVHVLLATVGVYLITKSLIAFFAMT
ncbi:MAG: sulfite exporter TauE/SafE family protein [Planctomycetes bacterium]|nr:sulfite exporter TauE/SafE family protein [Planctomycetota bacterium]